MTELMQTSAPTSGRALFGFTETHHEELADKLDKEARQHFKHTFKVMGPSARAALIRALADVVVDLVDVNLIDVLLGGWRKLDTMRGAAERSLTLPGDKEVVELASHMVTSVHHPYVDVSIDETRVTTLHFELRFELEVHSLVATISGGDLVAIAAGHADVSGSFAFEGVELAEGKGKLDLPFTIELGKGIPLVPRAARPS